MTRETGGVSETVAPGSVDSPWVVAAIGSSLGGLIVHNLSEFPPAILVSPETLGPVVVTLLLGVGMLRRPGSGVFLAAAAWAVVSFVIGGASVLPLAIWPFTPAQSVGHYAAHAAYAVGQLPLLWVAIQGFRAEAER